MLNVCVTLPFVPGTLLSHAANAPPPSHRHAGLLAARSLRSARPPKSHVHAKLLLEIARLPPQFAEVQTRLPRGRRAQPDRIVLDFGIDAPHGLRIVRVESHRDAQDRCQLPHAQPFGGSQRTVQTMVRLGRGFTVITTRQATTCCW